MKFEFKRGSRKVSKIRNDPYKESYSDFYDIARKNTVFMGDVWTVKNTDTYKKLSIN